LPTAHKPGIIPLRPLTFTDVLDGATKHHRRNAGPVTSLSMVVNAIAVLPSIVLLVAFYAGSWFSQTGASQVVSSGSAAGLLALAGPALGVLVLTGLLSYAVAEATLGRRVGVGDIWRVARPRLWALIGSQALVALALALPWALTVGVVVGLSHGDIPVLVLVGGLATVGAGVVDALLLPRLLLIAPVVALEGLGVRAASARAWALARGRLLAIFFQWVVTVLLAVIVFWVLQLPLQLFGNLMVYLLDLDYAQAAAVQAFVGPVSTILGAAFVTPTVAAVPVLHYLDARMRKEGFDMVLARTVTAGMGGPT
jgi:hypothetical protein